MNHHTHLELSDHATNNLKTYCGISHGITIDIAGSLQLEVGEFINLHEVDTKINLDASDMFEDWAKPMILNLKKVSLWNSLLLKIHEKGSLDIYCNKEGITITTYYCDVILTQNEYEEK